MFADWNTTNHLTRILGQNILQDAEGLLRFTRYWEDKVLTLPRCQWKLYDAIEDANNERNYDEHVRGRWYQHVLGAACPADATDREWLNLINQAIHTWRKAAEFVIEKREAGLKMIEEKNEFLQASRNATTLADIL